MPKKHKQIEFEYLVAPLMRWLQENYHPHIVVMLTSTRTEVLEGQYNFLLPFEELKP